MGRGVILKASETNAAATGDERLKLHAALLTQI
jgi:hypothetical protein